MDNRAQVREFLASRRARITPVQAGLPAYGGNRRVKGLRREEVALLAGVSIDYYIRMERGDLAGASEAVLDGVANALQLDEAEREHLRALARSARPTAARRARPSPTGFIHTSPVKFDDGVFTVAVLGFLSMRCPSYRAGRCCLGSHAHKSQSTRLCALVGVSAVTGNGGASLAAARSPTVESWATEHRSASSSPPGGPGSPPTRPACPPTVATAGSRACAGKRSRCWPGSVRPVIQQVLDAITEAPAWIRNARHDILAMNPLARALYSPVLDSDVAGARAKRAPNTTRFIYLDPGAREFFVDYDRIATDAAAMLRLEAGRNPHDKDLITLVGELSTQSELFRQHWASHNVKFHRSGRKRLRHPAVGELDLNFEAMELSSEPGLRLNLYTADPGTPTADGLKLLASWAATRAVPSTSASG